MYVYVHSRVKVLSHFRQSVCLSIRQKSHCWQFRQSSNSYTWPWQGFFLSHSGWKCEAVCLSTISYLSLWIVLICFQTVKSLPGYKTESETGCNHKCRLRSIIAAVSWRKHTGKVLCQVRQQYIWLVISSSTQTTELVKSAFTFLEIYLGTHGHETRYTWARD